MRGPSPRHAAGRAPRRATHAIHTQPLACPARTPAFGPSLPARAPRRGYPAAIQKRAACRCRRLASPGSPPTAFQQTTPAGRHKRFFSWLLQVRTGRRPTPVHRSESSLRAMQSSQRNFLFGAGKSVSLETLEPGRRHNFFSLFSPGARPPRDQAKCHEDVAFHTWTRTLTQ